MTKLFVKDKYTQEQLIEDLHERINELEAEVDHLRIQLYDANAKYTLLNNEVKH